ncbi:hypothetical protein TYRP_002655 [Tyrophagus putrescentiae]|nr:hypothetical protein TYRP_002655 [Tyrophagus putrescentiae]
MTARGCFCPFFFSFSFCCYFFSAGVLVILLMTEVLENKKKWETMKMRYVVYSISLYSPL